MGAGLNPSRFYVEIEGHLDEERVALALGAREPLTGTIQPIAPKVHTRHMCVSVDTRRETWPGGERPMATF